MATTETRRKSLHLSPGLACESSNDPIATMEHLHLDSSPRESLSRFSSGNMFHSDTSDTSSPLERRALPPFTEEVSWATALHIQAGSNFEKVPSPTPHSATLPQHLEEKIDEPAGTRRNSQITPEEWAQTIASLAPSVQYEGM